MNATLTEKTHLLLLKLVSEQRLETDWLDLLSQLEFVGARKIAKSLRFESVGLDQLRHLSEEASHAYLLKKVVENRGVERRSWVDSPFAEIGWKYFQELDHEISALCSGDAYQAVSWTVEERVMDIYPMYIEMTEDPMVKNTLERIMAQEKQHSAQFSDLSEGRKAQYREIEARHWESFVEALHHRLEN